MILVVGATGLVGSEVCSILTQGGQQVRGLTRSTSDPAKTERLTKMGVTCVQGDLKDPDSLAKACEGVQAIVTTASATLAQQEGDSLETVDQDGQIALIDAAVQAGVGKVVHVSVPLFEGLDIPLSAAKRAVENHLVNSGLDYTILRPNYFMEVWLGPALGFDHANAKVTIYGEGTNSLSWVSFKDVAAVSAKAIAHEQCRKGTFDLGGPPVSPNEVVEIFERVSGRSFEVTRMPSADLKAQFEQADHPLQKTFSGLMYAYALGCPMDSTALLGALGHTLVTVEDYAKAVSAAS